MKNLLVAWVLFFQFAGVAIAASDEIDFAFFGDSGSGDKYQRQVAGALRTYCEGKCQFVLLLGDNFYEKGVKNVWDPQWRTKFELPYGPLEIPFFVVLGNHDYEGNVQAQVAYSQKSTQWKLPSRYHRFSQGVVDFFVLDTSKLDSQQLKWLKDGLEGSTAKWKIVAGHHPIFSYGHHGDTPEMIRDVWPTVKKYATFYLSGHDHDQQVLTDSGVDFVVSGGGGAELREVKSGPRTRFAKSVRGFGHFHIGPERAELEMIGTDTKPIYQLEYRPRLNFTQHTGARKTAAQSADSP